MCTGPHIPTTGKVKAFSLEKVCGAFWLGKTNNDALQRVYGLSFPQEKLLKEYK